jgi:hypothetical protein
MICEFDQIAPPDPQSIVGLIFSGGRVLRDWLIGHLLVLDRHLICNVKDACVKKL